MDDMTKSFQMNDYSELVPECQLFVDRRCFPGWEIVRQQICFHDLTFIAGGKGSYFVNDRKFDVAAGDIVYIPEGSTREAHTSRQDPMHAFAFNFILQPDNRLRLPFATVTKHHFTAEIRDYIREFNHVWISKQPGYRMLARSLLLAILHRMLTVSHYRHNRQEADARIEQVKSYMIDHYSESLTLDTVSELVDLHPVYFSRLFKQYTGFTFRQFLNRIRINHAEMMLSSGGFTVSEVAELCGYKDIGYFSNVFRSIKGFPPSFILKKLQP